MSEINSQALREAAVAIETVATPQKLLAFRMKVTPQVVLALLDERERNQQYIKRRDQENEDIALTVGKLRVELEAEKQRAKDLFMENARLKSGIAGLIHLGIRYADVEVMRIAGDAQLSTPCTDSIITALQQAFASKESDMSAITKERIKLFIKNPLDNGLTRGEQMELARIALASLEREQIRHEHAKWSDSTFGCVGPIGPLKHLSKEALEAAAEPDDLSEWADMQFLLWDAQRRAGISDAEITAAMEDKLKINMERQWPEPKDGEPRLHIKEPGNYPVTPDGWISCSERMPEMGERQCYVLAADFKNNYPPNIPNTQVGVYGDWFNDGNPTWDDGDGEDLYLKEVTHWMPLPEPPRLKEL